MVSTGDLLALSQSSVLLPQYRSRASIQAQHCTPCFRICTTPLSIKTTPNLILYRQIAVKQQSRNQFSSVIRGSVAPEKLDFVEGTEVQLDNSGGGGDIGGGEGNNWGGSGGGGDGEGVPEEPKKMTGMSMSQKLTLAYAALVGLGGLMGYLKSGSQKSLLSGGISAALLFYVYTQLPVNPVFASCIGLGLSAALLGVMGSRFKKSGKVFPAGVVSIVSLIMSGGYLHGVMRSLH